MTGRGRGLQHQLALALAERVRDEEVGEVEAALGGIRRALKASSRLRQILVHPAVGSSEKSAMLRSLADLPEPAVELLLAMSGNRALGLLGGVMREFRALRLARAVEAAVEVESAVPLAADELQRVSAAVTGALKRPVRLTVRTRKNLIGGFRMRVGERIVDGTVLGALEQLERRLVA